MSLDQLSEFLRSVIQGFMMICIMIGLCGLAFLYVTAGTGTFYTPRDKNKDEEKP